MQKNLRGNRLELLLLRDTVQNNLKRNSNVAAAYFFQPLIPGLQFGWEDDQEDIVLLLLCLVLDLLDDVLEPIPGCELSQPGILNCQL